RLWTGDNCGKASTSLSASMITSGGASITTSRDACTATKATLATRLRSWNSLAQLLGYQPISAIGVVLDGGGPTGPAGVRENRGAAACSTPWAVITVDRTFKWSPTAASLHVNTGVTHASVPAKTPVHSSRVRLANRSANSSCICGYDAK